MLGITLWVIISHYIADFLVQTEWQATNKSKNNKALASHAIEYTCIITILIFAFNFGLTQTHSSQSFWLFATITFISHFVTDYITSRESNKLYEQKKIRRFWYVIGFDQLLHYA